MAEMKTDLERAFDALTKKKVEYDRLFNYYDGNQPIAYSSERLKQVMETLDWKISENWCSVVIDSCRDRVNLSKFQVSAGRLQEMIDRWWDELDLSLESDEVHEACMVTGEAFVIAWEGDTDGQPDAYFNDPRMCHVFYDAGQPRKKRFGAKRWMDDEGKMRMTLYYPDRLEYYWSKNKNFDEAISSYKSLVPIDELMAKNPFGVVPIFHFRMGRRVLKSGIMKSDLVNVIPLQDAVNKLFSNLIMNAEYLAYPQRYVISNADQLGKLKNSPNEVWDLPAGDGIGQQTQAGQFSAADLENYTKTMDNLITAISSITRTPKHYFFSVGSNLSGEALIAMEAPLNKKAANRIERFTPVWRQVVAFLFQVAGIQVDPRAISPVFDLPETIQPRTEAETRDLNVRAGMALETVWREEGKSEAWIEQALADIKRQKEAEQASLGEALLNAQRNFSQPTPNPSFDKLRTGSEGGENGEGANE